MAGTDNVILYQRGEKNEEDHDSDVWDDTALIEAYNAAVGPLKERLAEHTGDATVLDGGKKGTASAHSKKRRNRNANKKKKAEKAKKKQQAGGWAVGDFCQAVYTEDGTLYEAKIVSINSDINTCVVRYLGYGNEEEQSLEDLIPHESSSHKQGRSNSISCSETDSVTSRQSSASHKGSKKSRSSSARWAWPNFANVGHSSHPHAHSAPPPPPLYPGMHSHSHSPYNAPQPPWGSAASMPFPMMPPPPPPMPDDHASDENEALCSMLLSWYMSGYHTGYYQGLRQSREHEASGATGPSR